MYSGNMIDVLIQFVQRAEEHAAMESNLALLKAVEHMDGFSTYIYERSQAQRSGGSATQ